MKKLLLILAFLISPMLYGQSAGAIRTQEIYSSTGHVKVDNTIGTIVTTVTYADPTTFNANLGNHFIETLTGNVASSSLTNAVSGEDYYFSICQDATGSRTFAWPANFLNAPTIIATASKCTSVVGFYDGTSFRITGRWDTSGTTGGSGTVTSVGLNGDGTVLNSTVTNSPVTSSGTMALTLANANSNTVLAGPVGASGTNVAIRQDKQTPATGTNPTITFSNNIISGSVIVVMVPKFTNASNTVTDTQGNTFTRHATTSTVTDVFTATAGSSGADTITYNNAAAFATGETLLAFELVGTGAYHAGVGCVGNISSNTCTNSITPSNATNGFLEVATYTGSSAASYNATSLSVNPQASLFDSWTTATSTIQGRAWVYAPQTTSAVNTVITGPSMGLNVEMEFITVDFVQSSSAGSGPPVYRSLTEGDLPSTAKAAIQSVNRYDMSAATMVITGANTANSIVAATFTMPSDGCPCRILGSYNVYWDESGAGDTFDFWLSDGTNAWAPVERNVVSAAGPGVAASGMSPVAYSNGQSVTVTLYGASGTTADGTVRKAPANSVNPVNTGMVLTVMQSIN